VSKELRYKPHALVEDLAIGECTIHRATGSGAGRWWLLWFHDLRETDGKPEWFGVPVNPNGDYIVDGPGGKTWGLRLVPGERGAWQIAPSIDVGADRDAHGTTNAGQQSIWHQTPKISTMPFYPPGPDIEEHAVRAGNFLTRVIRRIEEFWQRVTEGIAVQELWRILRAEDRRDGTRSRSEARAGAAAARGARRA
jgi:hypothetical protein